MLEGLLLLFLKPGNWFYVTFTLVSWEQDSHYDSRTTSRFDNNHPVTVKIMPGIGYRSIELNAHPRRHAKLHFEHFFIIFNTTYIVRPLDVSYKR